MKILMISTRYNVFRPDSGAPYRISSIYDALTNLEYEVVLVQPKFAEKPIAKIYEFNSFKIENLLYYFSDFNLFFIRKLKEALLKDRPDVIQISFPWGVSIAKRLTKQPVVFESHGVESDFAELLMKKAPRILRRILLYYIRRIEEKACKSCDHMIVLSSIDKFNYCRRGFSKPEKISVIPPFKRDLFSPRFKLRSKEITIVFHGDYRHPANSDAVALIRDYIVPSVSAKRKKVNFLIFGSNNPQYKTEYITSLGYVRDYCRLLGSSDIAIVPIRFGSGVRIKVLDYLMCGLPIVSTIKGVEGIEIRNGVEAFIVHDVNQDFVGRVIDLIDKPWLREKMGQNARIKFLTNYSFEAGVRKLDAFYRNIIDVGKSGRSARSL